MLTAIRIAHRVLRYPDLLLQDGSGGTYAARRAQRSRGRIRGELPALDWALEGYQHRLAEIAGVCRRKGVRVVFCSQPVLWSSPADPTVEHLLWAGWSEHPGEYYETAALREGVDRFNQALADFCLRHGAERVDLSDLSGRKELFVDDCHFNELGAREVADRLAAYLERTTKRP
jgi:hypothetical protein